MTTYDQAIGYDAAIPYDGGALPAAVDRNPAQNLRLEVAFATDPDAAAPAWVDLSDRVHLPSGITIRRGRGDEFEFVQTGTMTVSLENLDGALSPDNPSSPYYPNVLPQRRCRLTYRDPATYGQRNIVDAPSASFESATLGRWGVGPFTSLANSTTRAADGTRSLLVTWPTAASGVGRITLPIDGLTIGRRYTATLQAWVPTGVPNLRIAGGSTGGSDLTVKNAWGTSTVSWVATATSTAIELFTLGASTAGQQTWVDAVMMDETPVGVSLGSFTTTPASSAVLARFDGRVDRWPIEWPDGGQTYSRATITATDMLASLGARRVLRSVVTETIALDAPVVHFPLGEGSDSTTVASVAGKAATLSIEQLGTGGTLELGAATGVPTDGVGAPRWESSTRTNGKYLTGKIPTIGRATKTAGEGCAIEAAVASTSVLGEASVTLSDRRGNRLHFGYNSVGNPYARFDPYNAIGPAITSWAVAYNNGETHQLAVTLQGTGSGVSLALIVDGVLRDTATTGGIGAAFETLTIGGMAGVEVMQAGTVSHVAAWDVPLLTSRFLEHRVAETTGFAGERSDQRLARVATWIGLPAERCAFDVGNSTSVGHIDTTGNDPLTYMRKIETTEAGLLFAATDGRLTFHNRARSYSNAAPALSLTADMLDPSAGMAKDLQLVRNDVSGSRSGGATVRQVDAASVAAYGALTDDLDVVTTTDDDVAARVAWQLATSRTPLTRFTSMDLDALTDAASSPLIRSLVDIGVRVEITGMPSQAPASTQRQVVQGYTENITDSSWSLSINATPYGHLVALVLDDPVYGALDTYPLAY